MSLFHWIAAIIKFLTAPVSSLREGMRPLMRLEKNESGIHVNVCLDVENLMKDYTHNYANKTIISAIAAH